MRRILTVALIACVSPALFDCSDNPAGPQPEDQPCDFSRDNVSFNGTITFQTGSRSIVALKGDTGNFVTITPDAATTKCLIDDIFYEPSTSQYVTNVWTWPDEDGPDKPRYQLYKLVGTDRLEVWPGLPCGHYSASPRDGSLVVQSCDSSSVLGIISLQTAVIDTLFCCEPAYTIWWVRSARFGGEGWVYFTRDGQNWTLDLWRVRDDGDGLSKIAEGLEWGTWPFDVSTARAALTYVTNAGELIVSTLDGSDSQVLSAGARHPVHFSPDGHQIAFNRRVSDELCTCDSPCVIGIDGTQARVLRDSHPELYCIDCCRRAPLGGMDEIVWSPDGLSLVMFASEYYWTPARDYGLRFEVWVAQSSFSTINRIWSGSKPGVVGALSWFGD